MTSASAQGPHQALRLMQFNAEGQSKKLEAEMGEGHVI